MRAKEYLSQVKRLTAEVRRLEDEIKLNRSRLLGAGLDYSRDRVQVSPADRLPDIMADILELEREQAEKIRELCLKRDKILEEISAVPDVQHGELLYLRYVCDWRFERIAKRLGISFDRARHLHGEALRAFEEIFDDDTK